MFSPTVNVFLLRPVKTTGPMLGTWKSHRISVEWKTSAGGNSVLELSLFLQRAAESWGRGERCQGRVSPFTNVATLTAQVAVSALKSLNQTRVWSSPGSRRRSGRRRSGGTSLQTSLQFPVRQFSSTRDKHSFWFENCGHAWHFSHASVKLEIKCQQAVVIRSAHRTRAWLCDQNIATVTNCSLVALQKTCSSFVQNYIPFPRAKVDGLCLRSLKCWRVVDVNKLQLWQLSAKWASCGWQILCPELASSVQILPFRLRSHVFRVVTRLHSACWQLSYTIRQRQKVLTSAKN